MTAPVVKQHQSEFLVTITGIAGNWDRRTGGAKESAISETVDGGTGVLHQKGARPRYEPLVLSRTYELAREPDLEALLDEQVGVGLYTITEQPLDARRTAQGRPAIYANCLLSRVAPGDSDSNSAEFRTIELTFAVPSRA